MTVTVTPVELGGSPGRPLVLLGPSIGTTAELLWGDVARRLADDFRVVGWDLPGHGTNPHVPDAPYVASDLAAAVLAVADDLGHERFCYAGDSIGGVVGQQLCLDAPDRVGAVAVVCSSPRFGDPQSWRDRAVLVREQGTEAAVEGSRQRWFPDAFAERRPEVVDALLQSLRDADAEGYAGCCGVLERFDSREQLAAIEVPLLAIAGAEDGSVPVDWMRLIADSVQHGRLVVLEGVGHQAPAEDPDAVARLLHQHFSPAPTDGMSVRRAVLGDAHVDRATAAATDLTREFQAFITEYAWGGIWTRPGLDRRSRSMITLTALIARGHHEELAMHVRAAIRNGLTRDELKEVLLQSAIYCGVPDANTAFRIAQKVLDEMDQEDQ